MTQALIPGELGFALSEIAFPSCLLCTIDGPGARERLAVRVQDGARFE